MKKPENDIAERTKRLAEKYSIENIEHMIADASTYRDNLINEIQEQNITPTRIQTKNRFWIANFFMNLL